MEHPGGIPHAGKIHLADALENIGDAAHNLPPNLVMEIVSQEYHFYYTPSCGLLQGRGEKSKCSPKIFREAFFDGRRLPFFFVN